MHQNRKIPTPPNSPFEGRKVVSTLEVDVALDPSPLAFAPWSLKYQAQNNSHDNDNASNNKCTSVKIRIDEHLLSPEKSTQNVQIESSSDCTKSFEEPTEPMNYEKLPPIPTLSIVVEECCVIPENGIENEGAVQVEVHRHEGNNVIIEHQNDDKPEQRLLNSEDPLMNNKDYLKIPSAYYG